MPIAEDQTLTLSKYILRTVATNTCRKGDLRPRVTNYLDPYHPMGGRCGKNLTPPRRNHTHRSLPPQGTNGPTKGPHKWIPQGTITPGGNLTQTPQEPKTWGPNLMEVAPTRDIHNPK